MLLGILRRTRFIQFSTKAGKFGDKPKSPLSKEKKQNSIDKNSINAQNEAKKSMNKEDSNKLNPQNKTKAQATANQPFKRDQSQTFGEKKSQSQGQQIAKEEKQKLRAAEERKLLEEEMRRRAQTTDNWDVDKEEEQPVYQKEDKSTKGWRIYRLIFWGTTLLLAWQYKIAHDYILSKKRTSILKEDWAIPYVIEFVEPLAYTYEAMKSLYNDPPVKKLLSDTVHDSFHPKTLVLSFSNNLLTIQHIFGKGTKVTRRPGLKKLLNNLAQKYEIVIFTNEDSQFLNNNMAYVDSRSRLIAGCFGSECMTYENGKLTRNIQYLNRDPKKVIVVDINDQLMSKQPQNLLKVKPFKGENEDDEFDKLLVLLEKMAPAEVSDVRMFLKRYNNSLETFTQEMNRKQKQDKKKSNQFTIFSLFK